MDELRQALRGDCHAHTDWSDGSDSLPDMVRAAAEQGHDYLAVTDHSPSLKIAHGLSATRLRRQLAIISEINQGLSGTGFQVLTGVEVDILVDGSLDQDPELLAQLDVVVGSVHTDLRAPASAMTRRMVRALADPHLDILGHCTGRRLPVATDERHAAAQRRPPSAFDADAVFTAALRHDKAIEINCRPDRLDPPSALLRRAAAVDGLRFAIDTDAHAVDQLGWQAIGTARALVAGIAAARVVNCLPADELLDWTASHG